MNTLWELEHKCPGPWCRTCGTTRIEVARDNAIRRADVHANKDWKTVAYEVGQILARDNDNLISEDIMEAMPLWVSTHEPRALGAVMRRLAKNGFIVATSEYVRSTSPLGHARPSVVWRSLVWRP